MLMYGYESEEIAPLPSRITEAGTAMGNRHLSCCQPLVSSIKVEVKKKHLSSGRNFSCFAAHVMEQDLF
jgi:hypothetical protein